MLDQEKAKRCAEAIEKSKAVVRQAFKEFRVEDIAITWTGGKDSTLTLWIIRQACLEDKSRIPKVMTIDEFDVFEEVHDFVKRYAEEWKLELEWCRNDDAVKAAGGKLNNMVRVKDLNERNQAELKRIGFRRSLSCSRRSHTPGIIC